MRRRYEETLSEKVRLAPARSRWFYLLMALATWR